MLSLLRRALELLSPRERRQFAWVSIASTLAGLLQVAGIASIIPFVSALLDAGAASRSGIAGRVYAASGFSDPRSFLMFAGVGALVMLIVGNAATAASTWLVAKFTWDTQLRLSTRLLAYYLAQPYAMFLVRNSAEFTRNVLFESTAVVIGILMPLATILTSVANTSLLLGFLMLLSPSVTLVTASVLAGAYSVIYWSVRRALYATGAGRVVANQERLKVVAEAFNSIKTLKVSGRESVFVERYGSAAREVAHAAIVAQTIGRWPRFAIETVAFAMLIGTLLVMLHVGADVRTVLPAAVAFAFAGLRLVPALQGIYGTLGPLRLEAPLLDTIVADYRTQVSATAIPRATPLKVAREIQVEAVGFTYPGTAAASLHDVTLSIRHPSFVAFVGRTGAGKTTLADVILGLLEPQRGRVIIDGVPLSAENRRAWQANIGYVPQDVVLMDDTISANIAFGVPREAASAEAVRRAARTAGIHEFIDSLQRGYDTVVGERGVRLSGGQRQRIGLARALYHDPAVLVLDEATSALDHETEVAVHQAVVSSAKAKTVIVIAHRFTTIRDSERIFVLDRGRLVASGTYEELLRTSAAFRRIAPDGAWVGGGGVSEQAGQP